MKIGFIGAGKAGNSLARYFAKNKIRINGFFSKSYEHANQAADSVDSAAFFTLEEIIGQSDIIFITTPDGVIGEIWKQIRQLAQAGKVKPDGKIFAHCSGSVSSEVFQDIDDFGAFGCSAHPMLAISSRETDLSSAFFTLEGSETAVNQIKNLLERCGNSAAVMEPQCKTKYHAAASVASNLMVGLAQMAVELLEECGFSGQDAEKMLGSLILGNAENICTQGTVQALTGPAERCDINTVMGHLHALEGNRREIYRLLSLNLIDIAKKKNPDRDYSVLKKKLEEER